jgi:OOP family OmpA-OmpF porin
MARNKVMSTVAVVFAVLGLAAPPALADKNSGFYVGGGAGQSSMLDVSNLCNNQLPALGVPVTSCDNKGIAWKGFAGYQFIRYFGVELGYYDFGKSTAKTPFGDLDYKARGPYAGIVVTAPMTEKLSIIGRAGALRWSTKVNVAGVEATSDHGINGSFGLGLEYMFTDHFGVRGEFERFLSVGNDATTGETNINVWTVSGLARF